MKEKSKIHLLTYVVFFVGVYISYHIYLILEKINSADAIYQEHLKNVYSIKNEKIQREDEYNNLQAILDEETSQ